MLYFLRGRTLFERKRLRACAGVTTKIWGSRERGVQHAHSRLPLSLKKNDVEDYTFSFPFLFFKKKTKFVRFVRSKNPPDISTALYVCAFSLYSRTRFFFEAKYQGSLTTPSPLITTESAAAPPPFFYPMGSQPREKRNGAT